ncbi:MAG: hypothetical protein WC058_04825 [Phycisphaeraceae bacterium]
MFRICRLIVVLVMACLALVFSDTPSAVASTSVSFPSVSSVCLAMSSDSAPAQHALPSDGSVSVCTDALPHASVLAAVVPGVSLFTSLKTIAFIYGLAAVIAFLVAMLIKLMAMTLHRL